MRKLTKIEKEILLQAAIRIDADLELPIHQRTGMCLAIEKATSAKLKGKVKYKTRVKLKDGIEDFYHGPNYFNYFGFWWPDKFKKFQEQRVMALLFYREAG